MQLFYHKNKTEIPSLSPPLPSAHLLPVLFCSWVISIYFPNSVCFGFFFSFVHNKHRSHPVPAFLLSTDPFRFYFGDKGKTRSFSVDRIIVRSIFIQPPLQGHLNFDDCRRNCSEHQGKNFPCWFCSPTRSPEATAGSQCSSSFICLLKETLHRFPKWGHCFTSFPHRTPSRLLHTESQMPW